MGILRHRAWLSGGRATGAGARGVKVPWHLAVMSAPPASVSLCGVRRQADVPGAGEGGTPEPRWADPGVCGQLWGCRRLWCLRPGVCARPARQQGQEDVLGSAQLPPSLQRNVKRRGCSSSPAPDTPKAGSSTSCLTRVVVPPLSRWFRKFQRAEGSHKGGQRVLASWPTQFPRASQGDLLVSSSQSAGEHPASVSLSGKGRQWCWRSRAH